MPPGGPPKKKRTGLIIGLVIGVAAILLLGAGGVIAAVVFLGGDNYAEGNCVKQDEGGSSDRAVSVSCDDAGAYKIVKRLENTTDSKKCPNPGDPAFINFNDKYVLCLDKVKD